MNLNTGISPPIYCRDHLGMKHFNPLNYELIPICHLLALLGRAAIVDVSRLRVKAPWTINHTALFVCFWTDSHQWAWATSFTSFLDHTQRRNTLGMTPPHEWSGRCKQPYLITHSSQQRKTFMLPVCLEHKISAGEQPQTYSVDRAATGTDNTSLQKKNPFFLR
jgi:hypothetical protein